VFARCGAGCAGPYTGLLCPRCPTRLINNSDEGIYAGSMLCDGTLYRATAAVPVGEGQRVVLRWGVNNSLPTAELYAGAAPLGFLRRAETLALRGMITKTGAVSAGVVCTGPGGARGDGDGDWDMSDEYHVPGEESVTVNVSFFVRGATTARVKTAFAVLQRAARGYDVRFLPAPSPHPAKFARRGARGRRARAEQPPAVQSAAKSQEELEDMFTGLEEDRAGLDRFDPARAAGLRLQLLDHQLEGVAWMLRQERGDGAGGAEALPPLWEAFNVTEEAGSARGLPDAAAGRVGYAFALTNTVQWQRPTRVRGGLVADDMGLGKTAQVNH
jgi:hypothetical protein